MGPDSTVPAVGQNTSPSIYNHRRYSHSSVSQSYNTVLTNLSVQERQSLACITVAITIVAQSCGAVNFAFWPFLNEHCMMAELYVRTGGLGHFPSCSSMSGRKVDSVVAMLEKVMRRRSDLVHWQSRVSSNCQCHLVALRRRRCWARLRRFGQCSVMYLRTTLMIWPNCFETRLRRTSSASSWSLHSRASPSSAYYAA